MIYFYAKQNTGNSVKSVKVNLSVIEGTGTTQTGM